MGAFGSRSSTLLQEEELDQLQIDTGFSANQIERLYSRFAVLDKSNHGFLFREDFLRIPELAINPLGDRIVESFFADSVDDRVNFKQFIKVLACFRPISESANDDGLNSRIEKLRFAFRMYDLDQDNYISQTELLSVLHMMVGDNISVQQLDSIVNRAVEEADTDNDGLISFEEFQAAMLSSDVERKMSIKFLN